MKYTRPSGGSDVKDVLKSAGKNPKVDAGKALKPGEWLRILGARGVSGPGYGLAPPFPRRMHAECEHGKTECRMPVQGFRTGDGGAGAAPAPARW